MERFFKAEEQEGYKPRIVGVMIAVLLHPLAALGQDYRALSLDECLALAREQNPVLSASREKIRELLADYNAARSKFFPRLVLTSSYSRQPSDRFAPGGFTPFELFKREGLTAVTGKQIIFDGLKTYNNTRAARYGTEAQKEEVQRTADEVAFTVTEAFYRLIEAKENLRVAQEARSQRQEFGKLTEAFYQAGKVTNLDHVRAQSQVSEADHLAAVERHLRDLVGAEAAATILYDDPELAREIIDGRGTVDDVVRQLSMHKYRASLAVEHARRYTLPQLEEIYRRLLELDTAIKTGQMAGDLALEVLVIELTQ